MSLNPPARKELQAALPSISIIHGEKINHYFCTTSQGKKQMLFYSDDIFQAYPQCSFSGHKSVAAYEHFDNSATSNNSQWWWAAQKKNQVVWI